MKKRILIWSCALLVIISSYFAWAETITLTTYYPAPYGVYNDMVVMNSLGIGTTSPSEKLEIDGNIKASGTIDAARLSYDTGWINRSDWTNVHMGSYGTLNTDSEVTHNLDAPLCDIIVKILFSTDGSDDNSVEIDIGYKNFNATSYGVAVYQVDDDNIRVHTAVSGIPYVDENGNGLNLSTQSYYYRVKVYKLT